MLKGLLTESTENIPFEQLEKIDNQNKPTQILTDDSIDIKNSELSPGLH